MSVRRVIVDHVLFVVEDLQACRRLHSAALAPLGLEELHVQEDGVHYGAEGLDDFAIYRGSPLTTGAHVAFDAGAETRWTRYSKRLSRTVPRSEANRACGPSTRSATTRRS